MWNADTNVPAAVIESSEWHKCWELLQARISSPENKENLTPVPKEKSGEKFSKSAKMFLELHSESSVAAFS